MSRSIGYDYSHFYNEAGEPMQDGASMRFEMALDRELAEEDEYADYCDEDRDNDDE